MKSVHFIIAVVALAAAAAASAQTTTYTTQATFAANVLPGSYTEGFGNPSFSGDPSANFSGGSFAYTASAPGGLYGNGILLGTNLPGEALTITFTGAPVTAIGGNFWATDITDTFVLTPITLTLSNGTTTSFTPSSSTVGSFRGFTSALAITSMEISSVAAVYAGMDNFTIGSAVPEPGTWLLMGLGLGGMLLARSRKAI